MKMYSFDIEFDKSKANDGKYSRFNRIHKTIGYTQKIADIDANEDFYKKLMIIMTFVVE